MKIKGLVRSDRHSKGKQWLGRVVVAGAVSAGTLLGTSATPASAGVFDGWDYRYNHPSCQPWSSWGGCQTGLIAGAKSTYVSTANLLNDCKAGRARCQFFPTSRRAWTEYPALTNRIPNCGTVNNSYTFSWSRTFGTSSTVGVGLTGSTNNLWQAFQAAINVNYSHTWTESTTTSSSMTQNVPPRAEGWIERVTPVEEIKGWWKVNYTEPHWGHYEWSTPSVTYVNKATSGIQGTEGADAGRWLYATNRFNEAPYYWC